MKKFLILHIFLFSLSAFANGKWQFVVENTNGDMYYIDGNSYQKTGDSITFWLRTNYGERTKFGDLSDKTQIAINCRTRDNITRYMMTYDDRDNQGKITSRFASKDSWEPIAPDTVDWALMMHVCK